ncbi:nitroreductase family protein [Bradyrhizobium genosp. P]|uniref:nitroreductase family protein n=1 Tax=Bradyrhizobium genosp. P TaxID=83641 RepID=UPI003CFB8C11
MTDTVSSAVVNRAITSRRSVRAFLGKSIPREDIETVLDIASRAPSGANAQPGKVHVLTGEALPSLSEFLLARHNATGGPGVQPRSYGRGREAASRQAPENLLVCSKRFRWDEWGGSKRGLP